MNRPHTPEEIIGLALGFAVVVVAFFTALRALVELEASFRKSIKAWWRKRHPAKGWQPRRHRWARFWSPRSGPVGGAIMGVLVCAAAALMFFLIRRLS